MNSDADRVVEQRGDGKKIGLMSPTRMDRTLANGLALLEMLAHSDCPRGVTELAAEIGLQKSNVHRLLQTLAALGYVRKSATMPRYGCTLRLWEFGELIADRIDVRAVARPHLERLAKETLETVHLSILDGSDVVYIDKVDSPHPIRAYSRIGGRAPAVCVATGKALLAYMPPDQLTKLLTKPLHRFTPTTITNPQKLMQELTHVRRVGFAVNRGEWREGVNGIAAVIFDHRHQAAAAVGITSPAGRVGTPVVHRLAAIIFSTAETISSELGHQQKSSVALSGKSARKLR